jgi:hypothetical protein
MKQAGLCARLPRRFQVTTDSKHALPVAKNLLNQDFTASKADERWGGRYHVPVDGRRLAVSGRGPGPVQPSRCRLVHAGERCTRSWCWARCMALGQRRPDSGLLHHSDQGQPVRQHRLPDPAPGGADRLQHEPPRQLL